MLADRYGWKTAAAYQTNRLAFDSEDERRIKRAVTEAKTLQDEKIENLKEIFEIPLSRRISQQEVEEHSMKPKRFSNLVKQDLADSGFLENTEKSI